MLVDAHAHHASPFPHVRVYSVFDPIEPTPSFSIGLHPWDIPRAQGPERARIRELATSTECVAIGETGLDRARRIDWQAQLDWLYWHWDLAEELGKPLVLHAVRSSSDILHLIKQRRPRTPWLWHDFQGPLTVVKSALKLHPRLVFSLGARALCRRDFQELWGSIPAGQRLLETDESPQPLTSLYEEAGASEAELERTFQRLWGLSNGTHLGMRA